MLPNQDIKRLASLSMLTLSPEEAPETIKDMEDILNFAQEIMRFPSDSECRESVSLSLRDDTVSPSSSREAMLGNSKATKAGFISIPASTFEEK